VLERLTTQTGLEARTAGQPDVSELLLDKVANWLTRTALDGEDLDVIVRGFCERLSASGLPIMRAHLSFSMLHPLYDALGFTWVRGKGLEVEGFRKDGSPSDRFLKSPYYYLISNNLEHLRRRLDPAMPSEFPVFDDLKAIGGTDYLAFIHSFSSREDQGHDRLVDNRPSQRL
jgi:adenylate cyclase